jgi:hypothetical protein
MVLRLATPGSLMSAAKARPQASRGGGKSFRANRRAAASWRMQPVLKANVAEMLI